MYKFFIYLIEKFINNQIILKFHYMYFATFLFWLTAIVMVIVTLLTDEIEKYRV
jgi:hypothetical protein